MINLRQREFLAFPCSQLVRGSTEDGVAKKTLASHCAITRALVPGTSPGKVWAPWASPRSPSSMACPFPQIPRTTEAFLINGGVPVPQLFSSWCTHSLYLRRVLRLFTCHLPRPLVWVPWRTPRSGSWMQAGVCWGGFYFPSSIEGSVELVIFNVRLNWFR